ncbi:hypothetical protein C8J57DRAFT_1737542 [Mycena rebaudengoi]|nr:hypothetical protein C8J57DRAFT_1737542 [Mycena rebaudengoi]
MYFLDFIDGVHSDPPYRDLAFIIRPCEACAQKFVRAVRLVKLENAMRVRQMASTEFDPLPTFDHSRHFTQTILGLYQASYPADIQLTVNTAPMYMGALLCSSLDLQAFIPMAESGRVTAGFLADIVRTMDALGAPAVRIDALEFMEWNGQRSPVARFVGVGTDGHDTIPNWGRVMCRGYDTERQLWLHPFVGEAGRRADAIQSEEIHPEELADVFRSYMVNGVGVDLIRPAAASSPLRIACQHARSVRGQPYSSHATSVSITFVSDHSSETACTLLRFSGRALYIRRAASASSLSATQAGTTTPKLPLVYPALLSHITLYRRGDAE